MIELIMNRLTAAIILTIIMPSISFALAVPPQDSLTKEAVNPKIVYVDTFGFSGLGDGQFFNPTAIAVTSYGDISTSIGHIFVADGGNNRIQRLDKDGSYVYEFGGFGLNEGEFNNPSGIAVDFNRHIYISDRENHRVQKFDIRGNPILNFGEFGSSTRQFKKPAGLALDTWGNLYVVDSENDRVQKFNSNGIFIDVLGGFGMGDGFFDLPSDIAIDTRNNIYIADTRNNRIQVFNEYNDPILAFGEKGKELGKLDNPEGIAVDEHLIYVSDTGNNRIQIFDKEGNYLLSYDGFNHPTGIAIDRAHNLFVVNSGDNNIKYFKIIY